MCSSRKRSVPKIKPITPQQAAQQAAKQAPKPIPTPPPPPPPEPTAEAPVLNDERLEKSRSQNKLRQARRRGTRSLRIDLLIPASGSGLNVPG